jgi:hypothetical protein
MAALFVCPWDQHSEPTEVRPLFLFYFDKRTMAKFLNQAQEDLPSALDNSFS